MGRLRLKKAIALMLVVNFSFLNMHIAVAQDHDTYKPCPSEGHIGPFVIDSKAPGCTTEGYSDVKICKSCGEICENGTTINPLGHDFKIIENGQPATCYMQGRENGRKCTRCEYVEEEAIIDMVPHAVWDTEETPGYCGKLGEKTTYCRECGYVKETQSLPSKGHDFEIVLEKIDPTCEAEGQKQQKSCKKCGYTEFSDEDIKPLGHIWNEGSITRQPKIRMPGEKVYKCKRHGCNKTKVEEIPQLPFPKAGTSLKDTKKNIYTVLVASSEDTIVSIKTLANKNSKTVSIPKSLRMENVLWSVQGIGDNLLKNNKNLTKCNILGGIHYIGKSAFNGCAKLKALKEFDDIYKIGDYAFKNCKSLTSLTFNENRKSDQKFEIGAKAFYGCKKLKTLYIESTNITDSSLDKDTFKGLSKTTTIKVKRKFLKKYSKLFKKKGLSSKVKVKAI